MAVLLGATPPGIIIQTRLGNDIPNERRRERHPAAQQASIELHRKNHPLARLRSITALYNCVGLVLAARRAWVDTEHIMAALQDDGYRRLEDHREASAGDIVLYLTKGEVAHIGVLTWVFDELFTLRVLSKWGEDGEYVHALEDVPEFYRGTTEIWTERRVLR